MTQNNCQKLTIQTPNNSQNKSKKEMRTMDGWRKTIAKNCQQPKQQPTQQPKKKWGLRMDDAKQLPKIINTNTKQLPTQKPKRNEDCGCCEKQLSKIVKTKLKTQISKEKPSNNATQGHRSRETWPTTAQQPRFSGVVNLHPRGAMQLHRLQRLLWLDDVGQDLYWMDDVERSLIGWMTYWMTWMTWIYDNPGTWATAPWAILILAPFATSTRQK